MDSKQFKPPRNLKETKVWQETIGAAQQLWANYISALQSSFKTMVRADQCKLITRLSQIITVGVSAVGYSFFKDFLPLFVRVLAFPAILIGAWFIATKVVSPVIIKRLSKYLNQE